MRWLALGLALSLALGAQASCQGNSCPEQREAARAAGLLGSPANCADKKYPAVGTVPAVSIEQRILDLRWAANADGTPDGQHIFALTVDVDGLPGGPLWVSSNRGESFADVSPAIQQAMPQGAPSLTGVMDVHWHEKQPGRVLFQGKGRYHFVSSDYGTTFKALATPGDTAGFGHEIRLHPRQPDWLLAKVQRNECILDRRSPLCAYDLFLSQDFAASWTNLTAQSGGRVASFRDYDWGCKMAKYAGKDTPDEAIFATLYVTGTGQKGLYPGWDKDLHYAVSLDFFKTEIPRQQIVPCGNLFEIVAHKVYLAVPSECPLGPDHRERKVPKAGISGRTVTLYVSDEDGDAFQEACLPTALEDDGYNMVHTHDGYSALILADHAEKGSKGPQSDSPTSDAYAPSFNNLTSFYTLSLRNVFRREFITDFSRVEGVPGLFIANQVDPVALDRPAREYPNFLQTRLSTNGGADWAPIPAPASKWPKCGCKSGLPADHCHLHLHGPTSWLAPQGPRPNFYSHEGAPGLAIATGNVGPHLDFASGTSCTYASRDGGQTWEEVADFVGIYEFGNQGGLIVLAQHKTEGPTNRLLFSPDDGACWHSVELSEAITIDNIRTDPKGSGATFLVHGQSCFKSAAPASANCSFSGSGTPPSRLFMIDVKARMEGDWRDCNAAAGSNDYETSPLTRRADQCLLGAKLTLQRRRRDAGCFNTASYAVNVTRTELCECSLADAECEFGYQRNGTSCSKIAETCDMMACPAYKNSGYQASDTHLRLTYGNQCSDLKKVIPDTDGKGNMHGGGGGGRGGGGGGSSHSGVKKFFLFLLVAGILVVVAGVVWAHCLGEGAKDRALAAAMPALALAGAAFEWVLDHVITAWDWARARLAGAGQRSAAEAAYFEPLAEVDPEDARSPPLFPGR